MTIIDFKHLRQFVFIEELALRITQLELPAPKDFLKFAHQKINP